MPSSRERIRRGRPPRSLSQFGGLALVNLGEEEVAQAREVKIAYFGGGRGSASSTASAGWLIGRRISASRGAIAWNRPQRGWSGRGPD